MNNDIIYISKILEKRWIKGFKQLGNNPKALTKQLYIKKVLPNINNYYVTDKADGSRCFLRIAPQFIKIITSTSVNNISTKEYNFSSEYIFDCELINDIVYIFDVILYDGTIITNRNFTERRRLLINFVDKISGSRDIKIKTYYKLTFANYQQTLVNLYKKVKLPYKIDGLIFVEDGKNYNNTLNLKWKPPEALTIDFLALEDKTTNNYILCNGIKRDTADNFNINITEHTSKIIQEAFKIQILTQDYFPIPFYNSLIPGAFIFKSNQNINKHIVELSYDLAKNKWQFHKIRHDRDIELTNGTYYGNNYNIAESSLQTIINPLTFKNLVSSVEALVDDIYFKNQTNLYKATNKFNNFVKNKLILRYAESDIIMDLASGRGGDLNKYINAGVKNILFLENDINAIDELINRKYNILPKTDKSCNIMALCIDLNKNYEQNIKYINNSFLNVDNYVKIPTYGKNSIPVIFCNFAMHYLMHNDKSEKNIISFISYYLKVKGHFIMTIFDGQKVLDLLDKNNGKWAPEEKYLIEKKSNNKIKILLPFSKTLYEETLLFTDNLEKLFKLKNMKKIEDSSFENSLNEFTNLELNENDKTFVSLYKYIIFEKF
jgi:hypothetical protein